MSYTTLFAIAQDGSLVEWTRYRNASGSADAIWSVLCPKYCDNVVQLGEFWDPRGSKRAVHHNLSGVTSPLQELWDLANAGGMSDHDRRTCWTTYDRAAVRIENVPLYADALAQFDREHWAEFARLGHAYHIRTMVDGMRSVYAERELKGWRGVAWNQNSVANTWTEQKPTREMQRPAIAARIQELAPSLICDELEYVIDFALDLAERINDDSDLVPDNVDHFGALWLPGAGVETLT